MTKVSVGTMTVVVFFEDATIGELARDRIRTLVSKHPSRVIVLDATTTTPPQRDGSDDWIEEGVKSTDAGALRTTVSALRLAEAPVVLLWVAPGIGNDERFCELSREAQTVVYNSSLVRQGHEALAELVEYASAHPELPVADVAYLRLAPWQESVALLFDGKDADALAHLRRVEVACGSDPEALYLVGWLASRMGWRPESANSFTDRAENRVEFTIVREGEPRRVQRVSLSTSDTTYVAEVEKLGDAISLRVHGAGSHPERYRAINNPGIAVLVERAILAGHHDRIFQESLATTGEILSFLKEQQ